MRRLSENQLRQLGQENPLPLREEEVQRRIDDHVIVDFAGKSDEDIIDLCNERIQGLQEMHSLLAYEMGIAHLRRFVTRKYELRREMQPHMEAIEACKIIKKRAKGRVKSRGKDTT